MRSALFLFEATAGFEPAVGVLQTPALPLGYVARRWASIAEVPLSVKTQAASRASLDGFRLL